FDELGYRQEQRIYLELGILKLVHAQRILPLEQILSQVAGDTQETSEPQRVPAQRPAPVASSAPAIGTPASRQPSIVSPFEADRARKGRSFDPEMSATVSPVPAQEQPEIQSQTVATAMEVAVKEPETSDEPATILGHVLTALENMPG